MHLSRGPGWEGGRGPNLAGRPDIRRHRKRNGSKSRPYFETSLWDIRNIWSGLSVYFAIGMDSTDMARPPVYGQASALQSPRAELSRRKTRSACDRCHQQKLRCIQTKGKMGCERCVRLEMECRYSPRERRRKPVRTGSSAPRNLPPVIAPARSDSCGLQPSAMVTIPEVVDECDWLSFLGTGIGNAGGRGKPHIIIPKPYLLALTAS
jgi:hypothetical protein